MSSAPDEYATYSVSVPDHPTSMTAGPQGVSTEHTGAVVSDERDPLRGDSESFIDSEDEEQVERENRLRREHTSWYEWTKDERILVASLDQAQANDLSIHLYNVHAVEARLRSDGKIAKANAWDGKRSWLKRTIGVDVPWYPPPKWTAWPLSSQDVPRPKEAFGQAFQPHDSIDHTWKKDTRWHPSDDLKEEVEALMLRKAKERLETRRRVSCHVGPPTSKTSNLERRDDRDEAIGAASDLYQDNESRPSSVRGTRMQGDEGSSLDTGSIQQAQLIVDEEQIGRILGPSVRHILSRLDDLLFALHRSRSGHLTSQHQPFACRAKKRKRSSSAADAILSATEDTETISRASSRDGSMERNRETAQKTGQPRIDYSGNMSSVEDHASPTDRSGAQASRRRERLGLRDWSELLGAAALIGWDDAVIDRVARRCSALFGESMAFRKLPEKGTNDGPDAVTIYSPDLVEKPASLGELPAQASHHSSTSAFFCPVQTCERSQEPYTRLLRLRGHLKREHHWSQEHVLQYETSNSLAQREKATRGREAKDQYAPRAASANDFLDLIDIELPGYQK